MSHCFLSLILHLPFSNFGFVLTFSDMSAKVGFSEGFEADLAGLSLFSYLAYICWSFRLVWTDFEVSGKVCAPLYLMAPWAFLWLS